MHKHDYHLNPSSYYLALQGMMALFSAISLLILPINWLIAFALWLLIVGYLTYLYKKYGLLLADEAVKSLSYYRGTWSAFSRGEGRQAVTVLGDSFVSPFLVVLRLQTVASEKILTAVIFPDALDGEAFRSLRVNLRFG